MVWEGSSSRHASRMGRASANRPSATALLPSSASVRASFAPWSSAFSARSPARPVEAAGQVELAEGHRSHGGILDRGVEQRQRPLEGLELLEADERVQLLQQEGHGAAAAAARPGRRRAPRAAARSAASSSSRAAPSSLPRASPSATSSPASTRREHAAALDRDERRGAGGELAGLGLDVGVAVLGEQRLGQADPGRRVLADPSRGPAGTGALRARRARARRTRCRGTATR